MFRLKVIDKMRHILFRKSYEFTHAASKIKLATRSTGIDTRGKDSPPPLFSFVVITLDSNTLFTFFSKLHKRHRNLPKELYLILR